MPIELITTAVEDVPIAGVCARRRMAHSLSQAGPEATGTLVTAPGVYIEEEALSRFLAWAQERPIPASWASGDSIVANFFPQGVPARPLEMQPRVMPAEDIGWHRIDQPLGLARAEERLYEGLRSESDGYLARLDRRISIAISKRLMRTPVTPNQITTASLALGVLGCVGLVYGGYALQVASAALLALTCVLDGCDGEVARLKLLSSEWGARYDVIADNIVHVALFVAIAINVRQAHPDLRWFWPSALMLSGLIACILTVWWLILRKPSQERGAVDRVFERIASRDFIYLVLALVIARKLHWFVWGVAAGAHVFWISLIALSLMTPSRTQAVEA